MLTVPVTLPVSKYVATMTALIGEIRMNETLAPSEIVDELVSSCRIGNVEYGKGILYNFKMKSITGKDLSETSSAFTISKPNVQQEIITIDQYKFFPISVSDYLTRDAFLSGEMLGGFMESILALMRDSAQFLLFDVMNNLYQNWEPGQETQTVSVPQIPEGEAKGADLEAIRKMNATNIAKVMRKTMNNMKIKNTKFTDIAGQESCLSGADMKLVLNDEFQTNFLADSLASLYHEERVGDMIPGGNIVTLPVDAMSSGNAQTIGWLHDRTKFALADFYTVTLSILDPSTLYTNHFYHIAFGAGVFSRAPGVKFVATAAGA